METEIKLSTIITLLLIIIVIGLLFCCIIFLDNNTIEKVDVSDMKVNEGEVNFWLDKIDNNEQSKYITIRLWAFKHGNDIATVECYVCIKDVNNNEYYKVNTMKVNREDVTTFFNDGFNYDNSGILAKFSKKKMGQGTYEIHLLYLSDGNNILVPIGQTFEIK